MIEVPVRIEDHLGFHAEFVDQRDPALHLVARIDEHARLALRPRDDEPVFLEGTGRESLDEDSHWNSHLGPRGNVTPTHDAGQNRARRARI